MGQRGKFDREMREIYTNIKQQDINRFEKKIIKTKSGCWEWQGSFHHKGYGYFSIRHTVIYAHRFSYCAYIGEIPDGMLVCHKCDNGRCVNPDHLFIGTYEDNTNDMMKKGRGVFYSGVKSPVSKLNSSQVMEITSMRGIESSRKVAARFGVSHTIILNIWNGISYKDEVQR